MPPPANASTTSLAGRRRKIKRSKSDSGSNDGKRPSGQHPPDYDVGYKRPPRQHQFRKGQPSANPKGRPRGSHNRVLDLRKILMEMVSITKAGRNRKVPFPAAHLQRIMERAAKGDPKADQSLFQLYKAMNLFTPEESDATYEFTIDLGPPRKKS